MTDSFCDLVCIGCANGNDLPEGEHCRMCGRKGSATGLGAAVVRARRGYMHPKTSEERRLAMARWLQDNPNALVRACRQWSSRDLRPLEAQDEARAIMFAAADMVEFEIIGKEPRVRQNLSQRLRDAWSVMCGRHVVIRVQKTIPLTPAERGY